ncbi:D-arabinono-1,4-lactone oxidase [Planococcus versutus]
MKVDKGKTWKNWAHTSESTPENTFYPTSIEDVCKLVKEASKQQKKIKVVGAGHSFTSLVQTSEWLVSLDQFSGIETINEEACYATVLGGTRLFQIGEALGKRGYAQENLGDVNVQSIAGAISTGTHGTGIAFGNISTQVLEVVLVTGTGEILTISENNNPAYFKACLVSLGSLGIIVKVTIKIIPSPVYEYKSQKIAYSQLSQQLEQLIKSNRHFEFYLFPYSDVVQVKTMNAVEQKAQRMELHHFKNLVMENYLFFVISETCRILPKSSRFFSKISAKGVSTTIKRANSYQLFATPRLVRFREMEYCIPLENLKPALEKIRECIVTKKHKVHFPIECRTVKADDIWISPSYQRDSAYIAFHMYKGMPYEEYFHDMESIMQQFDGRPHWAKMHTRTTEDLLTLYPKLSDFLAVREELDPEGIFMNDYLNTLFNGERASRPPR